MARSAGMQFFQRKSLDEITTVPDEIISVYVVENHIWADGGSDEARAARRAETRTVDEFLLDPVRSFLNYVFRQMSGPYRPQRKDNPIGQGYWIQAEFGSGKSHLLSFVGALALGGEKEWELVREKERKAGLGRRESLYHFYESGLAKKSRESKGIFVAVKTLVGEGGGAIGMGGTGKALAEYVLDAVAEQFYLETGRSLPLYPTELLAERFLETDDFERYRRDLARYLQDPAFFDEEQREDIADFIDDLQNNPDPGVRRDCGQRLWDFYERYLTIRPQIPMEAEAVLKHMVHRLLDEGYAGLLLILDEVSLFMKGRTDAQRVEDEKTLVVLSNRLAKVENLPVWTVCAAQQAIESKMAGVKNIIARERLDLVPLLNDQESYYDIALSRVREITDPAAVDQYYEDYKRSFSWPQAVGKDRFVHFFPFYPPSVDVVRAVSYNLTTVRSALYFMLQTLKTQRKRGSGELITLWALFDDVVKYEEDPSGTTKSIASIKTRWPNEWKAYETARHQLGTLIKGRLKVYHGRCEKIVKTLFLYHVANLAPAGLSHEELMNSVMEWRDQDSGQEADLQDNLDHYEVLTDEIALELAQVVKVGRNFRFNPTGNGTDPREHFQKARAEVEQNELLRRQAWEALLALDGWEITTRVMTLNLAQGIRSIFRDSAPASQHDLTVQWHGREIAGRVYMRDLLDIAGRGALLPSVNSSETGLDYAVFISSTPLTEELDRLVTGKKDPRVLFWTPDELTPTERSLLVDFGAYRELVREFAGRDTEEARQVLDWVQSRLREQMGTIYRIVPDSYARGRVAALDHSQLDFSVEGELSAILTPLVGQVLETVYVSRELEFDAPAPFNDVNAVNVINGIVKAGEIPRGARPTKEVSAAQNYGFALQIMRRPDNRRLDLSECRYTHDMLEWIEDKLGASGESIPVMTLFKNFMGLGGPGGLNYGLSRRMVQLYLLCLVREGKLRVSLSGRNLPVDALDYSNVADVNFRAAVLDGFDRVQRLQPPEGWEVLAPFAAVLLDDQDLRESRRDAEIQDGVRRLLAFKQDALPDLAGLCAGMQDLFAELEVANPLTERLGEWETFLASPVGQGNPIPFLLHALDESFGYRAYRDDLARSQDVDDLATRRAEVQQARDFFRHRDRLCAAARYLRWAQACAGGLAGLAAADPVLADAAATFQDRRSSLEDVGKLVASESHLISELLEPVEAAIQSYGVRYLQLFDRVTAHTERARQQMAALPQQPAFRALERLAQVPQLGTDPRPALERTFQEALEGPPELFPEDLTRAAVERDLRAWPQPPGCPLTLQDAGEWSRRADAAMARCEQAMRQALLEKARLLHSDALRERLAQGQDHPFIAGLLDAPTAEEVADYLGRNRVFSEKPGFSDPDPIDLLTRYLKKLRVRRVRLADFAPSKRTLERADVDAVVAEFRAFLLEALEGGDEDEDELPVIELDSST